jgi:LPXTG-motif cell wall-anchored protein
MNTDTWVRQPLPTGRLVLALLTALSLVGAHTVVGSAPAQATSAADTQELETLVDDVAGPVVEGPAQTVSVSNVWEHDDGEPASQVAEALDVRFEVLAPEELADGAEPLVLDDEGSLDLPVGEEVVVVGQELTLDGEELGTLEAGDELDLDGEQLGDLVDDGTVCTVTAPDDLGALTATTEDDDAVVTVTNGLVCVQQAEVTQEGPQVASVPVTVSKDWSHDGDAPAREVAEVIDVDFEIDVAGEGALLPAGDSVAVPVGETLRVTAETLSVDGDAVATLQDGGSTTLTSEQLPHVLDDDVLCTVSAPEELGTHTASAQDDDVTLAPENQIECSGVGIELTKAAGVDELVDPEPGDEVEYHFAIENTGELKLESVYLVDIVGVLPAVVADGSLAIEPGETIVFGDPDLLGVSDPAQRFDAHVHEISSASIQVGAVTSLGVAAGIIEGADDLGLPEPGIDGPAGLVGSTIGSLDDLGGLMDGGTDLDPDLLDLDLPVVVDMAAHQLELILTQDVAQNAGIDLDKSVDGDTVMEVGAEDTAVAYEFTVTNTGNVALEQLRLEDERLGDLTSSLRALVEEEHGEPVLPPGASVVLGAEDEITAEDRDAGEIRGEATASGVGTSQGQQVEDVDRATVLLIEVLDVGAASAGGGQPGSMLPATGADSDSYVLLGVLLALLGATVLVLTGGRRSMPYA